MVKYVSNMHDDETSLVKLCHKADDQLVDSVINVMIQLLSERDCFFINVLNLKKIVKSNM